MPWSNQGGGGGRKGGGNGGGPWGQGPWGSGGSGGGGNQPPDLSRRLALAPSARMREWIEGRRKVAATPRYRYNDIASAVARMREANPGLDDQHVQHLAVHAVRRNEDGTFSWKYDPYVRHGLALDLNPEQVRELWAQIVCPVLFAWGTRSWAANPADDGTIQHFRNARSVAFDGGHWLHHDCFEQFMDRLRQFLKLGN